MNRQLPFTDQIQRSGTSSATDDSFLAAYYKRLFALADIVPNGSRPWDIIIRDPRFYRRILLQGSIGLGESYMEGWWDAPQLDELFHRVLRARLNEKVINLPRTTALLGAALKNLQNIRRSKKVGEQHYDIGNDFYAAMLDPYMVYTCGYWREATDLNQAQIDKLELVCQKLRLEPGMRVLDIGCGWGSFARYAAEKYKAKVVGITISAEQLELARKNCAELGVEIRLQDYREIDETFDRVVSLGMFEHVGHKNYRTYMQCVARNLASDGLFLLHTIGLNDQGTGIDPWVTKYIFPNSEIPALTRVTEAFDNLFLLEDLHNFGTDYDKTLLAWFKNFDRNWHRFAAELPQTFYRMWKYYLLMFAGAFRARHLQLWQLVLSPRDTLGGYTRPLR